MKYTKELTTKNHFNYSVLEPSNPVLKNIYNFLMILPILMYMGLVLMLIPMTISFDIFRSIKFQYYMFNRQFIPKLLHIRARYNYVPHISYKLMRNIRYSKVVLYYTFKSYKIPQHQKQTT